MTGSSSKNAEKNGFVPAGHDRARQASIDRVTPEVEARYAPALAKAGFWRRIRLRRRMRKEIEQRMEKLAPRDALYLAPPSADRP